MGASDEPTSLGVLDDPVEPPGAGGGTAWFRDPRVRWEGWAPSSTTTQSSSQSEPGAGFGAAKRIQI